MSIIQFKEANCKNCYKCIRNCPVKAIAFKNEQAQIVEEDCMLCGNCLAACPQNAKSVKSDVDIVKSYIRKKEKVYVSLAPSFISAFEYTDEKNIFAALKKLGFTYVEETAVGATEVSRQYEKLMNDKKMKNIITTACPSINFLVEKYYPELIGQLAPVVSPMIAHAKILRETYGSRIRIVFIGPCISKKQECNDLQDSGMVDAVITFEELANWMNDENVYVNGEFTEEIKASKGFSARIYPVPGGILKTIGNKFKKNYRCMGIDGVDRCIKILDSIKGDNIKGYFLEMNSCQGGCMGGPCINHEIGFIEARERLVEYYKKDIGSYSPSNINITSKIDFSKRFIDRSKKADIPSEKIIQGILNSIGKFTKDKELNCGACGYPTCRDKAIAVYNNKAQATMCLPYMRERAESISNIIINSSPNAIIAIDTDLKIQEINMSAIKMFNLNNESMIGKKITDVLPSEDFENVLESSINIYNNKYFYDKYGLTVKQSIFKVPEHNTIVAIIQDITKEELKLKQVYETRSKNVDIAQKVIEKQMRVAQEIASLLGETTAETKVALTKLKKSIMEEASE